MALGEGADTADERQASVALTMVEMALSEASEVFRNPDRGSNWEIADGAAMLAIGRASRSAFTHIHSIAAKYPKMQETLGEFLDVGTGLQVSRSKQPGPALISKLMGSIYGNQHWSSPGKT
jgi:hypothetical protein